MNKSHSACFSFFSPDSSCPAVHSPSVSLTLSRVSTVTVSARAPHWTWQPAICMPDYFSSSLGLFLALSFSVPCSLLPYAGRIENNSATDGRQHARPCPTRLRIHFICARGEWIKINDGRTFIAFWGWRRDWGGERQKLWSNTCASYWGRLAESLIFEWDTTMEWRQNVDRTINHAWDKF